MYAVLLSNFQPEIFQSPTGLAMIEAVGVSANFPFTLDEASPDPLVSESLELSSSQPEIIPSEHKAAAAARTEKNFVFILFLVVWFIQPKKCYHKKIPPASLAPGRKRLLFLRHEELR